MNDLNQDKSLPLNNDEREVDQIHMAGKWLDADLLALEAFLKSYLPYSNLN